MKKSRVPLFGLPHRVTVIRRVPGDDGAGGLDDEGSEDVLYTSKKCRITTVEPDDEELRGFGYNAQQHRRVIMPYSPSIHRKNEFLRIPFGVPPNVYSGDLAPDGSASEYTVTHPTGSEVLTWDKFLAKWQNLATTMRMEFVGGAWTFEDEINVLTTIVADLTDSTHNPWIHHSWPWNPSGSYGITQGPATDHRIIWHKHQYDETGGVHHTSVVIELEDEDT